MYQKEYKYFKHIFYTNIIYFTAAIHVVQHALCKTHTELTQASAQAL